MLLRINPILTRERDGCPCCDILLNRESGIPSGPPVFITTIHHNTTKFAQHHGIDTSPYELLIIIKPHLKATLQFFRYGLMAIFIVHS